MQQSTVCDTLRLLPVFGIKIDLIFKEKIEFMKPDWREVPRDAVKGQWAALYVTRNRRGYIVMSRVTHERLGGPKAFQLLFDAVNNRIGLKPAAL